VQGGVTTRLSSKGISKIEDVIWIFAAVRYMTIAVPMPITYIRQHTDKY
jgi:hypothetical protein